MHILFILLHVNLSDSEISLQQVLPPEKGEVQYGRPHVTPMKIGESVLRNDCECVKDGEER